jgi:hypothetical protein
VVVALFVPLLSTQNTLYWLAPEVAINGTQAHHAVASELLLTVIKYPIFFPVKAVQTSVKELSVPVALHAV